MPHRLRLVILLGVLAVTFGLLAWSFLANTSPEEQAKPLARNQDDSRRSYPGPFLNIHPDVKYVGMEACGECHAGIADTYSRHGMARSLRPVKELARTQVYDGSHNNPFRAFGSLFRVDRDEGRVWTGRSGSMRRNNSGIALSSVEDYHGQGLCNVEGLNYDRKRRAGRNDPDRR